MDTSKLQTEIAAFAAERDWEQFHTVKNLILALVGEAGELAAVVQWLENVDREYLANNYAIKVSLEDELADVLIYLLRIADVADVNLEQAVKNKMAKNSVRYTVEKSKGNAEKQ